MEQLFEQKFKCHDNFSTFQKSLKLQLLDEDNIIRLF